MEAEAVCVQVCLEDAAEPCLFDLLAEAQVRLAIGGLAPAQRLARIGIVQSPGQAFALGFDGLDQRTAPAPLFCRTLGVMGNHQTPSLPCGLAGTGIEWHVGHQVAKVCIPACRYRPR